VSLFEKVSGNATMEAVRFRLVTNSRMMPGCNP